MCLEEQLKRIDADKNAYNQVGFSYDQSNNSKESSSKITEGIFYLRKKFLNPSKYKKDFYV